MTMILLLLSTLFFENLAPADAPESPVEWLGETTVDLGDLPKAEDVVHYFKFRNLTDRPITVSNVRAGCGCTATDWSDIPTAPGEVGSVKVTYDSMNDGFFRKYVRVYFDEHRGGHKLWLEGFVEG